MSVEIRPVRADEAEELYRAMGLGFGFDPRAELTQNFADQLEFERTRCVFDDGKMVGTSGAYSLDLAVPGGTVATGGTTIVSVRATHRRRGLLRAMMQAHFEDVREREEPLAALWASESSIYGRFGYGAASFSASCEIERAHSEFRTPFAGTGVIRLLEVEEARKLLPLVYDAVWGERPGHFARPTAWWMQRRTLDPEPFREGASAYRYALYEEGDSPRGYLQYRVKPGGDAVGIPTGTLLVQELQAIDVPATAALWRYALDVDLNATIRAWNRPLDDALFWLLRDPRRLKRSIFDAMWVRVMDVAAALEVRSYQVEGRLRFAIHDELCPWNKGCWELEATPAGARCRPSRAEPELAMDVAELGAVYLGANRLRELGRAGRVEGSPQALARADRLFGWDPAPWCPEVF